MLAQVLLLVSAPLVAASGASCSAAPNCTTCLGGTFGAQCGWCSVNTSLYTPSKGWVSGAQCADLNDPFDCSVQFQTDKCNAQGWTCKHGKTANTSQCVPQIGGMPDKASCEKSCKSPPPPPHGIKFTCNFPASPGSTVQPTCAPCTNATNSSDCRYSTSTACQKECAWKYQCDPISQTCSKGHYGSPTEAECKSSCHAAFQCDTSTMQCVNSSTTLPGPKFSDKTSCMANCPDKPGPIPRELQGVWRGLAIEHNYSTGEWVMNTTNQSIEIWAPNAPGTAGYALYLSGKATAMSNVKQPFVLTVDSAHGKLKGNVSILAHDFSMSPEVSGYIQFAINEASISTVPASYDTAMTTSANTVLGFESCPYDGSTSCTDSVLDCIFVIDGSASITSSHWQNALTFVNKMVDLFNPAPGGVRVGAVQFSESAATIIGLSDDKAKIKTAIATTQQMRLNTNTKAGLSQAQSLMNSGARANASKVVILITDGRPNMGDPKPTADAMKAQGMELFGVGVGSGTDPAEIKSLCSLPVSSHYFDVTAWSQLDKILKQLIGHTCHTTHNHTGVVSPHNCYFHLPVNLPVVLGDDLHEMVSEEADAWPMASLSRQLRAAHHMVADAKEAVKEAPATEVDPAFVSLLASGEPDDVDPCNQEPTCNTCVGATHGTYRCGWCEGTLKYKGQPVSAHCSGKQNTTSPTWTCDGDYHTTTCGKWGDCGLDGVYRGLRIDMGYELGEWSAVFKKGNVTAPNATDDVTIKYLDPAGGAGSTMTGKVQCGDNKKCATSDLVEFRMMLTNGTTIYGICGHGDQSQAETTGLYWAPSYAPLTKPPKSWDQAMLNTNATVYTYWKCAEYKAGTCTFVKP